MQINVSTRHGTISDATERKILAKVEKLGRYFERLTQIEVVVDLKRADEPLVEINVSAEHKHDFIASYQSSDLWGCIDQTIHKLEQQIKKYKEKIQTSHRGDAPPKTLTEFAAEAE
ncbi:MAG: ribosome-associated translation inhibitor RaiA [Planctomycetaceae bacterium]|nr:ribosome-associated translation inhibitor RaiA [Planctomycetaceae bacterium]